MVDLDSQSSALCITVCVLVAQSCPTVCNPMDCSTPSFSAHGLLRARILEWVAIPFSRGSSLPRDRIWVSSIAGRFFIYHLSHQELFLCIITTVHLGGEGRQGHRQSAAG